jgi:DNA-binding MarR family transcriptional regulator
MRELAQRGNRLDPDLALLTFLTPQTINVIVRNLERAGAIGKSAHASHGRILKLNATPKGRTLLKCCRARVAAIDACPARLPAKRRSGRCGAG